MPDPLLCTLPPGRHGLPREFVANNQRTRLVTALAPVLADDGYHSLTVSKIVKAAHLSRRTFYEHFDNKDRAVESLISFGFEQVLERIKDAAAGAEDPREAGMLALLGFVDEFPDLTRAVLAEGPAAAPDVYEAGMEQLAALVPLADPMQRTYVVGGIALILRRRKDLGTLTSRDLLTFAFGGGSSLTPSPSRS